MQIDGFIRERKVVKGTPDPEMAKALVKMSESSLDAARALNHEKSASQSLSLAYTSLRQILEAICLLRGYKVYSHEAFTAFLKDVGEEHHAETFDRLRKLRNGVEYYAEPTSLAISRRAIIDVERLRAILVKKYLRRKK